MAGGFGSNGNQNTASWFATLGMPALDGAGGGAGTKRFKGNIRTARRTPSDILVAAQKTDNLFVGLDLE